MNDELKPKVLTSTLAACLVIMALQIFSIIGTRDYSVSIPRLFVNIAIGAVIGGIVFGVMKVIGK